jgi:hypothetical protein
MLEISLPPVQPVVDTCIEVTPGQATDGHHQHTEQRDIAIQRTQLVIAVIENANRSDDAQHHVHAEPVSDLSQPAHPASMLAQRIQQQKQYQ